MPPLCRVCVPCLRPVSISVLPRKAAATSSGRADVVISHNRAAPRRAGCLARADQISRVTVLIERFDRLRGGRHCHGKHPYSSLCWIRIVYTTAPSTASLNQPQAVSRSRRSGASRAECLLLLSRKISRGDICGISAKAPCEAALMGESHVRIEISDSVLRTFVFHEPTRRRRAILRIRLQKALRCERSQSPGARRMLA